MPMTATMAPYTLFILDDDTPLNPREDYDCLGKMVCWHSRYSLGEKHDYDEPSDFLRSLLFSEYSSGHDRNNPVFAFLKSGKAKDARLEYNRSTREWELQENQHWHSNSDWYVSSSYAASLKDEVPDWFLDDCLSALSTGELLSLVEQMDGMVILPLCKSPDHHLSRERRLLSLVCGNPQRYAALHPARSLRTGWNPG